MILTIDIQPEIRRGLVAQAQAKVVSLTVLCTRSSPARCTQVRTLAVQSRLLCRASPPFLRSRHIPASPIGIF